jgi:hypothetical protein
MRIDQTGPFPGAPPSPPHEDVQITPPRRNGTALTFLTGCEDHVPSDPTEKAGVHYSGLSAHEGVRALVATCEQRGTDALGEAFLTGHERGRRTPLEEVVALTHAVV